VLLFIWRHALRVDRDQRWQERVYEGYYALAVDLTAFGSHLQGQENRGHPAG